MHRVWMTSNQLEQENALPRPAVLLAVPLETTIEHLFWYCQECTDGEFSILVA